MTFQRLYHFAIMPLIIVALFFLGGCTNSFEPIQESANAGNVIATATDKGLLAKSITLTDAKAVYVASYTLSGTLKTWQKAAEDPSTSAANITLVSNDAFAALTNLETAIAKVDSDAKVAGKLKLIYPAPQLSAKTKDSITLPEVNDIVNIILELEPGFAGILNGLFDGSTANDATVTAAITSLDTANAVLLKDIQSAGGTISFGVPSAYAMNVNP